MEKTIEIQVKIGDAFYEGKLSLQQPQSPMPTEQTTIEKAKDKSFPIFPDPYNKMLVISDENSFWKIKPSHWLGSDNFAEIAKIVREYRGEYVSAGKASHFKIPKKT